MVETCDMEYFLNYGTFLDYSQIGTDEAIVLLHISTNLVWPQMVPFLCY